MINVKNEADKTIVYVSGDIVSDSWRGFKDWMPEDVSTYPEDIRTLLDGASGAVEVRISSGGGDLFAGMAISNMLSRYGGHTKAIIDGLAASAASLIAFGCDEIEMPSNSYLMIHKPIVDVYGNSDDLLKWADTLDELQAGMVKTYARLAKVGDDDIKNMIDAETWLTGDKASECFDIAVTPAEVLTTGVGNCIKNYSNTPSVFLEDETESMTEEIDRTLLMY